MKTPPPPDHIRRGQAAENLALRFLQARGLSLLERNYRWRGGEIDLIMQDRDSVVFVEVRLRRNQRYGGALASIDQGKQKRLIQGAQHYLIRHRLDSAARFDVMALTPDKGGFIVDWIRDAFQASA